MSETLTQETTSTPQAAPAEASVSQANSSPDVSGKSTSEIAAMLGQLSQGGIEQPKEQAPAEANIPEQGQAAQVKPQDAVPIPDKFKNPDGTPNLAALTKSYSELEKQFGRMSNTAKENEMLRQHLADMQQEIEQSKQAQVTQQVNNGTANLENLTPEELNLLQNKPKEFVSMQVKKELEASRAEERKQRMADYELHTAINKARSELPGFTDLEGEIEKIAEQQFIGKSPQAIPFMYFAALGQKTEALVNSAKTKAYQEGYEKAKADMKLSVEGSGKDSTPADIGLNPDTVAKMSASEMEKLLPKSNRGTTSMYY